MKEIVYGAFGILLALLIFAGSVVGYTLYRTTQAQRAQNVTEDASLSG